jgi:NAD(P)-dependent dehydrogenase (short-subunit alcohol dehydrogenase family)
LRVFAGVRTEADATSLRDAGSDRLRPIQLDVSDDASVSAAAETVAGELDGARLAGIVNNAGIAVGGPVEFLPVTEWRRIYEVNVLGQVRMVQQFLQPLREGGGRIVNVSSIGGRFSQPFVAPYVSSKHAVEAISDALRIELRPWGIDVVLIEPGSVSTPLWDRSVRSAQTLLGDAPPRLFELYGKAVEVMMHVSNREASRGISPDRVAETIAKALLSSRPRTRYLVGIDARAMAAIRRWLPDRWRDSIIFRATGLPRRAG